MEKSDTQYREPETRSRPNPDTHAGHERAAELESGTIPEAPEKETPQRETLVRRTGARLGRVVRRIGHSRQTYVPYPT